MCFGYDNKESVSRQTDRQRETQNPNSDNTNSLVKSINNTHYVLFYYYFIFVLFSTVDQAQTRQRRGKSSSEIAILLQVTFDRWPLACYFAWFFFLLFSFVLL